MISLYTIERYISQGLLIVVLVISLFLAGQITGFQLGMNAAYGIASYEAGPRFSVHGPNFFELVSTSYEYLALCFLSYFVLNGTAWHPVTAIFRLVSLGIAIGIYCRLISFKYHIGADAVLLYRNWLDTSIRFDEFALGITLALMMNEAGILIYRYFRPNGK